MDFLYTENGKQIYGVPIGGLGSGSIGRGYRGEFCRFQLKPGIYEYNTVYADQFIVTIKDADKKTIFQSLLSTYEAPKNVLQSWKSLIDGSKCNYVGLYPRAWTEYNLTEYGIKLLCHQISPVIPKNYKDSSLPCAVFVWTVENTCDEDRIVTISFTFKNGVENIHDSGECTTSSFDTSEIDGLTLKHEIHNMECTYALAAKKSENINITKCKNFNPSGTGENVWLDLSKNGQFTKTDCMQKDYTSDFEDVGIGIACQTHVSPKTKQDIEMSLVWHLPEVYFGSMLSQLYDKYYTNFWDCPKEISNYALLNYKNWAQEIFKWQSSVLDDLELPEWYKSAIFNELYYVSDGGTVWLKLTPNEIENKLPGDPRLKYGRFAYLEGHEYRMYNTYDVHFYASIALAMLWPELQSVIQHDFHDYVYVELPQKYRALYDGHLVERKAKNSVPHDSGDPDECPFTLINGYPVHDVSEWRDLNSKFVLTVFRDYNIKVGDKDYLKYMYDACRTVMERSIVWDTDGDGLIENNGTPDQTYDLWIMKGASSYCGGLWLGALFAMTQMSKILENTTDFDRYSNLFKRALISFDKKLWNGTYYLFDTDSKMNDSIMADQLCGHWMTRCSGYNYNVFPEEKVKLALKTIYKNNVLKFGDGNMGAVNGYLPEGGVNCTSLQSEECWTGVTYSLASTMIFEGMLKEAWQTAGGLFKSMTEDFGMAYETPEAVYLTKFYRSIGYMRPLSIWSMQLAWERRKQLGTNC
ncbi:non-lysosomal glucosylceramidase isoform X2 [Chrysoperla carnea]|nr:non-lysosomal glucosylceramidase isoform X2 [Chrysoperla carnea]